MPFRSEAQRRFMWARHPEIAQRWTKEYGSKIQKAATRRLTKKGKSSGKS